MLWKKAVHRGSIPAFCLLAGFPNRSEGRYGAGAAFYPILRRRFQIGWYEFL